MTPGRHCTTDTLEYLRFHKGIKLLATEVEYNGCKSDILFLSSSGKTVTEYKIKVSKSDFKADFKKVLGRKRYRSAILKLSSYNDTQEQPKTTKGSFEPSIAKARVS